ncbi:MAG TPA: DNA cytosine methyltransferase [Sphingomicrobium sp.]|nr:DNA cytosine methyltransferase [Sphingomicrobium sp.]
MARPVVVDLFAGAGGMSLGFEQAGFDVAAAVELDPVHAAVHAFNFPDTKVLPRSVVGLTGEEIRIAAKLDHRRVDVVMGGAPCQGFSLIGQRVLDDPRNRLALEFVRIVRELDARFFVFENVKGLTLGKHRRFLDELVEAFRVAGYQIRTPWKVLDASDYGVPQKRERLILIGAKIGEKLPEYPQPITRAAGSQGERPEGPSCADALGDLPDAEAFATLDRADETKVEWWGEPSAYATELRCSKPEHWHFGYRRRWDPSVLTSSIRTDHSPISRRRFAVTSQGDVEPISRFFKLAASGVSNTLRAGTDGARGAFTSPRPIHYLHARCITVREMARLHGFPDWFRLHVTKWHGAREVGNAVVPPLARAVAGKIIDAMGITPERPVKTMAMGPKWLLEMDVTLAARHWGVTNPIGRRDKKSGATKRKQHEIELELAAIAAE